MELSWHNIVPGCHVGHIYILYAFPRFPTAVVFQVLYDMMDTTKSLLVDGYVSQTCQSRRAEQYFLALLKSPAIPPIMTLSYPGRESHFFFDPSSQLLDRAVVNRGTVVPQTMWSPHTVTDKRQHVEAALLQRPIFFEGGDGRLGLSLEASAAGRCHGLHNAQEFAPLGLKSTTHIRIVWAGYKDFKRQVQIRDETSVQNPITIARFAHHVGRSVDAFLKACEPDPGSTDSRRELWRIGQGGIQRSDIIVIGAIHVSAGSWMPILQLSRYIL
ncbi:hypothetical protein BJY52DRAFT_931878 [Lactarius psammicola]|nr:hypothetical protein BJY52DRAFT_931878 [Lactarius psammicola]